MQRPEHRIGHVMSYACTRLQICKGISNEMYESVSKVQDSIQLSLTKAEKVSRRGLLITQIVKC
jgi:hypothetical protein